MTVSMDGVSPYLEKNFEKIDKVLKLDNLKLN